MNTIEGFWLFCNPGDHYGLPSLIKIEDDIIQNYKFIATENELHLQLEYSARIAKTFEEIKSEFISENRMLLYLPGKKYISSGGNEEGILEDKIFINLYERLRSAVTNLDEEDILKLKFSLYWIKDGEFISFGEALDSPVINEMNLRMNSKGMRMNLQKFESTYFLSFWDDDYLEVILPIAEIDKTRIILSGFAEFPYERPGYIISER